MSVMVHYNDIKKGNISKYDEYLLSQTLPESILFEMISDSNNEFMLYLIPCSTDEKFQKTLVLSDSITVNNGTDYCKKYIDSYYKHNPGQIFQIDFNKVPNEIERFDVIFSNECGNNVQNFTMNIMTLQKMIKIKYFYHTENKKVIGVLSVGTLARTSIGWKFYPKFDTTYQDMYDYFYQNY